jgi:hypothetical protein
VISCCNISRRRTGAHADVVPMGVAVSTCATSKAGMWRVNRHVVRSPLACASTRMWCATACVCAQYAGTTVVCGGGRAGAIIASGADIVPFLFEYCIRVRTITEEKLLPLLQLHATERMLLVHARPRESDMQVGA